MQIPRPPYSAIIVLANLMDKHANLNEESRARMNAAASAFRAGDAPFLITSGWAYREDCDIPIACVMRDYAVECHKIPPESIIYDINSRDTVGDAVFTKHNIALPKGWNRLLVITSDYHAERTREIFTFIYGDAYHIEVKGVPVKMDNGFMEKERQSLQAFRSTFKDIPPGDDALILARLKAQHPFYNGTVYPKL